MGDAPGGIQPIWSMASFADAARMIGIFKIYKWWSEISGYPIFKKILGLKKQTLEKGAFTRSIFNFN